MSRGAGPGQRASPQTPALAQPATTGRGPPWGQCAQRLARWEGREAQSLPLAVASAVGVLDDSSHSPGHPGVGQGGPGGGCEALAGAGLALRPLLRRPARLLLGAAGEVHPLLIHPLGLHPLDEAEEVFVGHGGAAGQPVGRRAALVVDPGGLADTGAWVGGLALRVAGPASAGLHGPPRGRGCGPGPVLGPRGLGHLGPPWVCLGVSSGGPDPRNSPPRRAGQTTAAACGTRRRGDGAAGEAPETT